MGNAEREGFGPLVSRPALLGFYVDLLPIHQLLQRRLPPWPLHRDAIGRQDRLGLSRNPPPRLRVEELLEGSHAEAG
jgi:hypothetical protein